MDKAQRAAIKRCIRRHPDWNNKRVGKSTRALVADINKVRDEIGIPAGTNDGRTADGPPVTATAGGGDAANAGAAGVSKEEFSRMFNNRTKVNSVLPQIRRRFIPDVEMQRLTEVPGNRIFNHTVMVLKAVVVLFLVSDFVVLHRLSPTILSHFAHIDQISM